MNYFCLQNVNHRWAVSLYALYRCAVVHLRRSFWSRSPLFKYMTCNPNTKDSLILIWAFWDFLNRHVDSRAENVLNLEHYGWVDPLGVFRHLFSTACTVLIVPYVTICVSLWSASLYYACIKPFSDAMNGQRRLCNKVLAWQKTCSPKACHVALRTVKNKEKRY